MDLGSFNFSVKLKRIKTFRKKMKKMESIKTKEKRNLQ